MNESDIKTTFEVECMMDIWWVMSCSANWATVSDRHGAYSESILTANWKALIEITMNNTFRSLIIFIMAYILLILQKKKKPTLSEYRLESF